MKTNILAIGFAVMTIGGCGRTQSEATPDRSKPSPKAKAKATAEEAEENEAPPPKPKSKLDELREIETLGDAIEYARPEMDDTTNEFSKGTTILAAWGSATGRMRLTDIQALPNTEIPLIMKDPDEERGKKLCGSGSIIEIAVHKEASGKTAYGGVITDSMSIIRFVAVGSTGALVAQSYARICGVVIGRNDYSNSAGGVAHAVQIVGMFDIPENKPKK